MSVNGFRIGDGFTWVDLAPRMPYDGGHPQWLGSESVSIEGTTTRNRRAVKYRWELPLTIVDKAGYLLLITLYQSLGPWWFYDPSTVIQDVRPEPPAFTPPEPAPAVDGWFPVHITDFQRQFYNRNMIGVTLSLVQV